MIFYLSLAVSVSAIIVAVEGLPSPPYHPFITNDPSNNNPQPHRDEELIKDEDNGAMQSQEYDTNDGFKSKQIAFISTRMGVPYTKVYSSKRAMFPYAAIGELVNSEGGMCSGAFIREKVFLTAAHCLHTGGLGGHAKPASKILQKKGCDGDTGTVHHSKSDLGGSYIPANWINNGNDDYDYALVFTTKSSGKQIDMKVVTVNNALANTNVKIVGYPEEDNNNNCMMESACSVQGPDPNYSRRFYYNCDTSHGMSGGPVFNDDEKIIGIDSEGVDPNQPGEVFNKAVAMTQAVVDDIKSHLPK